MTVPQKVEEIDLLKTFEFVFSRFSEQVHKWERKKTLKHLQTFESEMFELNGYEATFSEWLHEIGLLRYYELCIVLEHKVGV